MQPSELAQRLAALDWSNTSLQHQLAVACAVETLAAGASMAVLYVTPEETNVINLQDFFKGPPEDEN
jgi:hypothetical protein